MSAQPEEDADAAEAPAAAIPAVPVAVGHDLNTRPQAADYGSWATYVTAAGPDTPRLILPYDKNRHRAVLIVSGIAGIVWVGTIAQVQASPPVGGLLPLGVTVVVENKQALYMVGDGTNSCKVSVLAERWDSGTGQ